MTKRVLAPLLLTLLATPAAAAEKIWSYDPADDRTRGFVDNGLTFVFDKGLMGFRVKEVLATQADAQAVVEPVGERELGARLEAVLPAGAFERELYAVRTDAEEGAAMVRAFCPGSTRGWLVFGPLRERRGVTVHALGDTPDGGPARLCATLNFVWRGSWDAPVRNPRLSDPRPILPSPF